MVFVILDLTKGEVVKEGDDLDELLSGLPEGIYEVFKDGEFYCFYSNVKSEHKSWI